MEKGVRSFWDGGQIFGSLFIKLLLYNGCNKKFRYLILKQYNEVFPTKNFQKK